MTAAENLPDELVALCDEFGLDRPTPGERWEFDLEDPPAGVGDRLVRAGCDLRQEYTTDEGRRYEYDVPEPGWPDPLGYVTTDEPAWVGPQHGWVRSGAFTGNVRGTIPGPGDCDRHPDLPADSFALSRVSIYPPGTDRKWGAKPALDPHGDEWAVCLLYEQANRRYGTKVYVYSSELGAFPDVTKWKTSEHRNTERRRIEFFETCDDAIAFVESETGLAVPPRGDGA